MKTSLQWKTELVGPGWHWGVILMTSVWMTTDNRGRLWTECVKFTLQQVAYDNFKYIVFIKTLLKTRMIFWNHETYINIFIYVY
jgi:hypothetical protein